MLLFRLLPLALLVSFAPASVGQENGPLPPLVFDDFSYESTAWVDDSGLDPDLNAGSVFGWNPWARSLDGTASTSPDRLWYRGSTWIESRYEREDLVRGLPGTRYAGVERGGLLLDAPAGYTGIRRGGHAAVLTGLSARRGTWAARINFSTLDDVRGLQQSFWTISPYVAMQSGRDDALRKTWTEVDHEFNNWFHFLWTPDPTPGRVLSDHYVSDGGSVFDATGYFEGGLTQEVALRPPPEPGEEPVPKHFCSLVRNETETYTLAPASCADLIAGTYPRMVYGLPVLDRDVAVDLLIRLSEDALTFGLQAVWDAAAPDGEGTDRYRLVMTSEPHTSTDGLPLPSQPMTARFSQYVTGGAHGTDFGDRPLMQDHPMVVDWFYYSPDATLTLDDVAAHVEQIRARNIPRLNTLREPLHRPYTKPGNIPDWPYMQANHEPAVFLKGPTNVAPGTEATFVGHYANRHGELRLVWRVRENHGAGFGAWRTVAEDAWFRETIPFPGTSGTAFEVQLQAGEYPVWGDWTQPPEAYVSRTLTYAWDASTRRFRLAGSR